MQPSKTGAELIAEARVFLQDQFDDPSLPDDSTFPYRYTTDELIAMVNNGLGEAQRKRPDLFLGQYASVNEPLTADNLDDWEFPIAMTYWQPMVNFVAGMSQARDDEFSQESRAGVLLGMFYDALGGER